MRLWKLALEGVTLGSLLATMTVGQEAAGQTLQQPSSVRQTAFEYDDYLSFAPQDKGTPAAADVKAAPAPKSQPLTDAAATVDSSAAAAAAAGTAGGEAAAADDKWTIPQPNALKAAGITLGGWIDQGVTLNSRQPADRFNGVHLFNDRANEYQLNQFYWFLKRDTDTKGAGVDWGGRVDLLYGTDARFTQAVDGLEATWGQVEHYQVALPQFYADVAVNDWIFRMGHFYTIIGNEVVTAPDNFFYSHSYTMVYGEPFTHLGMLGIYKLNDQITITNGFHRGLDQFDDRIDGKDALDYIGGITWTSKNQRLSGAFAITAGEQGFNNATTVYSLVGKVKLTDKLQYVVQNDYGESTSPYAAFGATPAGSSTARWYGLNQYLIYTICDHWAAGLRFEWFADNSGFLPGTTTVNGRPVTGARPGNALAGVPLQGDFYQVTAGLNWKPNGNWIIRPEIRWDWADAVGPAGQRPYNAGLSSDQLTFGVDAIFLF